MIEKRIGIIGCGAAVNQYYVPALKRHPEIRKTAFLVDTEPERAKAVARELGGGEIASRYEDIIGKVKGVIIALPHFLHHQVAMDFLKVGVHVLCEKPLAETAREVREMCQVGRGSGASLCVNNTRRMFPSLAKVKEILQSGHIGAIRSMKIVEGKSFAWPSATGFRMDPSVSSKGVLLDVGSHVLDTVCWWLGRKPHLIEFKDDSYGGPESTARLLAEADGCSVEVFLNWLNDLESRFEVTGEAGSLEGKLLEWGRVTLRLKTGRTETLKIPTEVKAYPDFIKPVVDNFLRVIEGKDRPIISGEDVLPSIELIEEAYARRSRFDMPWDAFPSVLKSRGRRVLVTGSTGFIGGRVVEAIHLTGDATVRAAIRTWGSAARLGRMRVEIVKMNLLRKEEVENALDGVTDVVHCAKGPYDVTVEGTRCLAEVAMQKGIDRFIHMSTTEVYGDVEGTVTEDFSLKYTKNEYNRMKIDAEKVCWEYQDKGLPVVVLRPSIVYGLFSRDWTVQFANLFLRRKGGILEKYGEGTCNLIYIDDLVRAILLYLDHEKAVGQAFNINGNEKLTWNEYFRHFNRILGMPPMDVISCSKIRMQTILSEPVRSAGRIVRAYFMAPVVKLAMHFSAVNTALRRTESTLKILPSERQLALYSRKAVFSPGKARDLTGYEAAFPVQKGLEITRQWLVQQGFLSFFKT
jgi:predicted dehydrogenase/nucleoside-diphosphate-sugar epimerase